MAQLYTDDICAFKSDPSIIGTVEHTWRDVDGDYVENVDCYFHHETPVEVRTEFLVHLRPSTGYVVVGFEQDYDFCCLVPETSLDLVDRALSAGDIVKRQLSDAGSGTVITTALSCSLRSLCTVDKFRTKNYAAAHGELSKAEVEAQITHSSEWNHISQHLDNIPAQELKYWSPYREDDYVIYQGWLGLIKDVTDEVTIRLSNGSVVVVQNPRELEEPYWMPGTRSSELHRRLVQSGYELHHRRKKRKPGKSWRAEPCYPGQIVETKKGNLRRGLWKFGAYNPNVTPRGLVVDVRTVQIEVSWRRRNFFQPGSAQETPPPDILNIDILQGGAVTVYDHSRQPRRTDPSQLSEASYSADVCFGLRVRFRDVSGAAVKYNDFDRILRASTQGYDMNPGALVSLKAQEIYDNDADATICKKVGVVQEADAAERIAKIRWFTNPRVTIPRGNISAVSVPEFGSISDDYSEVSLYDIVVYPALARSRGDLLIVAPYPLPPIDRVDSEQIGVHQQSVNETTPASDRVFQSHTRRNASTAPGRNVSPSEGSNLNPSSTDVDWFGEVVDLGLDGTMTVRLGAADEVRDVQLPYERVVIVAHSGEVSDSDDELSDSIWEDDLDLNDGMILPWDVQYTTGLRPDDASDDYMWLTEEDEDMPDLVDLSPPPEKKRQSADSEDGLSALVEPSTLIRHERQESSDEELAKVKDISGTPRSNEHLASSGGKLDQDRGPAGEVIPSADAQCLEQSRHQKSSIAAVATVNDTIEDKDSFTETIPPQFSILEEAPPRDHHYISQAPSLTSTKMRRITKEHQIMQSSLPEGVFVRTWEDRLDILRVLIIGPRETPYELAPFLIDFYFSDTFPVKPPEAYFHSWTNGVGRVNPNLYEDGNICLSLLGTWPGDNGHDVWSAKGSTMLQVIVSVLGLVLVREPYYNEAGFEILANTPDSVTTSAQYTERAFVLSRGFVQALFEKRPGGFDDVADWMYISRKGPRLLETVVGEARALLQRKKEDGEGLEASPGFGNGNRKLSRGAAILLERTVGWCEGFLREAEAGAGVGAEKKGDGDSPNPAPEEELEPKAR
ncbi:MAG: hypothetical protein Q9195_004338 [Heterodermia aff. obscurata]